MMTFKEYNVAELEACRQNFSTTLPRQITRPQPGGPVKF
jgi:hypothetical protein